MTIVSMSVVFGSLSLVMFQPQVLPFSYLNLAPLHLCSVGRFEHLSKSLSGRGRIANMFASTKTDKLMT